MTKKERINRRGRSEPLASQTDVYVRLLYSCFLGKSTEERQQSIHWSIGKHGAREGVKKGQQKGK